MLSFRVDPLAIMGEKVVTSDVEDEMSGVGFLAEFGDEVFGEVEPVVLSESQFEGWSRAQHTFQE